MCRIAQQERTLRFALEQLLCLVPIHLAPVETAAGDPLQIRYQAVDEVNLRVDPRHFLGMYDRIRQQ